MSDFFELKAPRLKVVFAAVAFAVALYGCNAMTVAPKPVNAKVVAFDENAQNAGIIDCDARGCLVTTGWYARYKALEKEFNRTILADVNIKPDGSGYRISYEVFENFAEMKRAKMGGP